MKITHIGHAAILIETQGLKILSDPWWRGPCFGAQWWIYPEPHLAALTDIKIDYVYISHGHEDHLHFGTLKTLDKSAHVLVAAGSRLVQGIRDHGFDVSEVDEHGVHELGNGVSCRIVPTYGGDTFMTLTDGKEVMVNLNDALHPLPKRIQQRFISRIKSYHSHIDYVFCGHGVASHFPNCYVIPGKDRDKTAQKRQLFFNESWARIIKGLAPRYGFPFAADVVLLEEDLLWANEPVHNTERPPAVFEHKYSGATTAVMDIAPGFIVSDGNVVCNNLQSELHNSDLRNIYRETIERANRYGTVSTEELVQVRSLLEENVQRHRAYLKTFSGDYRILFRFRNSDAGFEVNKRGRELQVNPVAVPGEPPQCYDLSYTTRLPYLRRSLTTRFGAETLFVGSGGIFEYFDSRQVLRNLHEEVMAMVSKSGPPTSRRKKNLKRFVKGLVNRDEFDLYNLDRWTVYTDDRC